MKIRTKLVISNLLVIIIPVIIMLGLIGVFVNGPGAMYWETMENIFDDENRIYTAESLLHTFKDEKDLDDIEKEMSKAGYHFYFAKDGQVLINNLQENDLTAGKMVAGSLYDSDSNYFISKDNVSVIGINYSNDGSVFKALAVRTPNIISSDGYSYMERYVTLYIGFIILIMVAAVIIVNMILSRWISRSIVPPLKKLSTGASLIRDGNLDFQMTYKKKDEMGRLISDFDEMRLHLKESVEERLKYEKYRKDLMIGISHDLRTPLTSIRGYLEGLKDGIANTEEMKLKYYDAIESSTKNMENLVSELTSFSKIESGEYHFNRERTELNEYYRACISDMNVKYSKNHISFDFLSSDPLIYSDIDRKEMERVTYNLVENTLKYRTEDCSQVTISISRNHSTATISIADDGPGVRQEDIERIFESFYRGDAARTNPGQGNGIGLAVVKQIVDGHGGSVSAINNNGLTIIIELPISDIKRGE